MKGFSILAMGWVWWGGGGLIRTIFESFSRVTLGARI